MNENLNFAYELFLPKLYMFRSTNHYLGDLPATQYRCHTSCQYSHKSSYCWLPFYISRRCQLRAEGVFRILAMLLVYMINVLPCIFK
jgi:hypothetical protein